MMEELARIALVGTSKLAVVMADGEHPADALVANLGGEDQEHLLLLRAGARAVFDQCGRKPIGGQTAPAACQGESRPVAASPKLAWLLQSAMATGASDLLGEFLEQFESAGLLLPHELLPQALSLDDAATRRGLLPVIGERGRWLARLNSDWAWVGAGVMDLGDCDRETLLKRWDDGNFNELCQVLDALRGRTPAEARDLIETVIDKEKPDHRARLVESLRTGLSPDDEPFLEARLDDRSVLVRRAAAGLLARLPGSALAGRMRERADAILSAENSWLRGKVKRIRCVPPEEIDKAWVRDGIPAEPPAGRGKRAAWTEAVLAAVPPSRWCERFAAEPADLIAAVLKDDFAESVLLGWTAAAAAFAQSDKGVADWMRPLWDHWLGIVRQPQSKSQQEAHWRLHTLLTAMSRHEAETAVAAMLANVAPSDSFDALLLLPLLSHPWSRAFSGGYLAAVRRAFQSSADHLTHRWAGTLSTAARAIPRDAFDDALALSGFAQSDAGNRWYEQLAAREVSKFVETIQFRRDVYDEITACKETALAGSLTSFPDR